MDQSSPIDIPNIARTVFIESFNKRASDVHIDPGSESVRIRLRVDGSLQEYATLSMAYHEQLMTHLKVLANLDITTVYTPQDGHFSFTFSNFNQQAQAQESVTLDVRMSIFPTIYGDSAVFRVANSANNILGLDNLGMNEIMLLGLRKQLKKNNGMFLITGPVGSGKTSTLYSILDEVINATKSAVALEDPIEFHFDKVRQIQMNPERGFTYAAGMRSILRQDPDIIMIGEVRDAETAEYAIRAALVGRLVFSTIHANSGIGTIARLIDMKIERSLVAYALNGVISSRLVKKNCNFCREEYVPSKEYLVFFGVDSADHKFYRGKGCDACAGNGYLGRIGIFEVLEFDTSLRSMIVEGASMSDLQKYIDTSGVKSLKGDALEKVFSGDVSLENVVTVI